MKIPGHFSTAINRARKPRPLEAFGNLHHPIYLGEWMSLEEPTPQGLALAEGLLADLQGSLAVSPETAVALRPFSLQLAPALLRAATRSRHQHWHNVKDLTGHQQLGLLVVAEKLGYIDCAAPGILNRIRPTHAFLSLAARHGISPTNAKLHFPAPGMEASPGRTGHLCVKAAFRAHGTICIGDEIALDESDLRAVQHESEIAEFGRFLRRFEIAPHGMPSFQRTFYNLRGEPMRWDRGGRIAAHGAKNFQQASPRARLKMTINGEPVVEIDVVACGLTIAHALAGAPIDLTCDPYCLEGLPRGVVKAFIVEKLGPRGRAGAWRRDAAKALGLKNVTLLETAHPAQRISRAVLQHFPVLKEQQDWTRIHFLESSMIWKTVQTLAVEHGVLALPVHDSIVVPISSADLAKRVLSLAFEQTIGCAPRLRCTARTLRSIEKLSEKRGTAALPEAAYAADQHR